jgi:RNA polymerase sigma-70 factor (ECF subfamily)
MSLVLARSLLASTGRMKSVDSTDARLIARVAGYDKQALESLYDRYSAAALGLAMKMVGERNSAEEIVQEAFWRVWKRASTFTAQRGEFSAWLFGIVHNLAIDELRRRRSRPPMAPTDLDDETVLDIPDSSVDVAETVSVTLAGEQVRAALVALPEAQRSVIELAYFQGLTHQEIAETLGEPIGTIHTRARLALQKLRELLMPLHLDEL